MRASVGEVSAVETSPRLPSLARARRAATVLRRSVGLIALAAVVYFGASIAIGAAAAPSKRVPARYGGFPAWLSGPLDGIGLPLNTQGFSVALVAMFGAYLVALACVGALRARWILVAVVLAHVAMLLAPPLVSADVMGYIDWGRMGALHGLSPYVHNSGAVVSDAVYPFVRWDNFHSPYGPLFTLVSYALVPLGVAGNLWAFKSIAVASSLGICWLIWDGAGRLGLERSFAIALYGLNPVVVIYAVGGAHNDLFAMAIVLAGCILVLREREFAGAALSTAAIAIKASTAVVLPFLLLGTERRRRALAGVAAAAAGVTVVALAVFGSHAAASIGVVGQQQRLQAGTTLIAQLGAVFGWTGDPPLARAVAGVVLAVAVAVLLWRTWRGAPWLEAAGWATLAVLLTTSWLLPWYVAWLMPLAALARSRLLGVLSIGFTAFVIATHVSGLKNTPTAADVRPLKHPAACVGSGAVGCPGRVAAKSPVVLQRTLARSFKRSYSAEIRMTTGRVIHKRLRYAKVRCHPLATSTWSCRVTYYFHARHEKHLAAYVVSVDRRRCFSATSRSFPARLHERVLDRPAPNPLTHIRSCP